jgi:hypothetical protein
MADGLDPKVSAAYRALGAEEPPRVLDDAILAASRRAVQLHPAPLVAPSGRRSWLVPLAAAAILVLAVGVTVHMQIEQPGIDGLPPAAERARPEAAVKSARPASPAPAAAPSAPAAVAPSDLASAEKGAAARSVPRAVTDETHERLARQQRLESPGARTPSGPEAADAARVAEMQASKTEAGSAASVAGAVAPLPAPARVAASEARAPAPQAAPAPAMAMAKRADAPAKDVADTPERELERIAELRKQGRHDEADKALAEFRKHYPEFKLTDAMRERVERR